VIVTLHVIDKSKMNFDFSFQSCSFERLPDTILNCLSIITYIFYKLFRSVWRSCWMIVHWTTRELRFQKMAKWQWTLMKEVMTCELIRVGGTDPWYGLLISEGAGMTPLPKLIFILFPLTTVEF